jgi:predicted metalloprotease with PDZ domain
MRTVGAQIPEGCSRYTFKLSRPLGLVLEEQGDQIVVGEVQAGGLAERQGEIQQGDILISTSGITFTAESEYGGAKVKSGEKRVTLNVRGEV